jgi:flagellar biosynthesis anti-sigma factor FlgM
VKINWTSPQIDIQQSDAASTPKTQIAQSDLLQPLDQAQFSSNSDKVSQLKAQAFSAPDVRQDLVASLRQQIQSGQYKVDPRQVANAILAELDGARDSH